MDRIEEIRENIYRIKVTLPNSPLGYLNSYLIRGDEDDYLIDTGFNQPECEEALTSGLKALGQDFSRINIINTHLHADHCGQNHKYLGEGKSVYMSDVDLAYQKFWYGRPRDNNSMREHLEGADDDFLNEMAKNAPGLKFRNPKMFERTIGVPDGHVFKIGDYELQVVVVPGHTKGNAMLWMEKEGLMFTGDHILFDISPNITIWPEVEDALGAYIASLQRSFDFPVEQALPGHRESGNYHYRINSLLGHHERRLNEIEDIIGNSEKPLNAFEITKRMRWKIHLNPDGSFPVTQMWFASGECLSHLDLLVKQGRIVREETRPYRTYKIKL